MRILMLGNSLTFCNDLPGLLAKRTGAEVAAHTRGGAHLAEQLNPKTKMGAKTLAAMETEAWDYVILQETSNGPVVSKDAYMKSVEGLAERSRKAGAVPVIYGTWAYEKGSLSLERMGIGRDDMAAAMKASFKEAAERTGALLADVGALFYARDDGETLYAPDGLHPSKKGSELAADVLAEVILKDWSKEK